MQLPSRSQVQLGLLLLLSAAALAHGEDYSVSIQYLNNQHMQSSQQLRAAQGVSCDNLHQVPKQDRCKVIKERCPEDSLIPYATWYYCTAVEKHVLLEVLFLGWLACLLPCFFCLLGDTAEHYFSPIMSQISQVIPKMRPRFAGVTFVALGNGAPDLSSNIAAIHAGEVQLSAGALTGAALFVQCIVAGELVAMGRGVKCRGAMMRDVGVYCVSITSVLVVFMLGRIGHGFVAWCLVLYAVYLIWVFSGDEWHARGRPQPDLAYLQGLLDRSRGRMSRQQLEDSLIPWASLDEEAGPSAGADNRAGGMLTSSHPPHPRPKLAPATELAAREGLGSAGVPPLQLLRTTAGADEANSPGSAGEEGEWGHVRTGLQSLPGATPSQPSYPTTPGSTASIPHGEQQRLVAPNTGARRSSLEYTGGVGGAGHMPTTTRASQHSQWAPGGPQTIEHGMYQQLVWADLAEDSEEEERLEEEIAAAAVAAQQQQAEQQHLQQAPDGYQPPSLPLDAPGGPAGAGQQPMQQQQQQGWGVVWQRQQEGPWDWAGLWKQIKWELSLGNSEEWESAGPVQRALREVAFNFLLHCYTLQRLTIPFAATSAGASPQWLIVSLLCCPLAFVLYMGWLDLAGVLAGMAVGIVAASLAVLLTWHDTPGCLPGDGWRSALVSQPENDVGVRVARAALSTVPGLLAVVGFIMGVVWISTIAGEVVASVGFLAALAGIPPGIMGLTLLAWGNSLGDFFGNRAMAKAGHANIAITACFAGPLFNMLLSLALGFSSYLRKLGQPSAPVVLTPELGLGCFFLIGYNIVLLCVGHLNQGRLPPWFALFARGWYAAYFVLAVLSGVVKGE